MNNDTLDFILYLFLLHPAFDWFWHSSRLLMITTDWPQGSSVLNFLAGEINKKPWESSVIKDNYLPLPPHYTFHFPVSLNLLSFSLLQASFLSFLFNYIRVWTVTDVLVYAKCQTSLQLHKKCSVNLFQINNVSLKFKRNSLHWGTG